MRHAIMVIGHGNPSVLQETISILDDSEIDFYVLWDEKYSLPNLTAEHSKIIFTPRIKIFWGTDSQVIAEKMLFDFVNNQDVDYDYVHLISSADIPLMDREYFKNFFKDDVYISYIDDFPSKIKTRIQFYYPFRNISPANPIVRYSLFKPVEAINKILKINRAKNVDIEKGSNWFSVKRKVLEEICNYPNFSIFLHSFCADEIYVQTVLKAHKDSKKGQDLHVACARYIDWNRGTPYLFKQEDMAELRSKVNTQYAFARKIQDSEIPRILFAKNKS